MTARDRKAKNTLLFIMAAAALAFGAAVYVQHKTVPQQAVGQISQSRTFDITYSVFIEDIPPQPRNLRVYVPRPLDGANQQMHNFAVLGDWSYTTVSETEYGNTFLVLTPDPDMLASADNAAIAIKFTVTRHSEHPLEMPSNTQMTSQQLNRYLLPDTLVPINGKVSAEAVQTAGDITDPFDQAKALYDNLVDSMTYDKSGLGWGRGDALYACTVRKGNCTDFHSLFIGQARSLNIPARFIMGLPLPEDRTEGTISGYHCWAEFYIAQMGWLPLDASEANLHPHKRQQLFAAIDADRVAFTIGRDIQLPATDAPPLNYSIYPYVEIDGKQHKSVKTTFAFTDRAPGGVY